MHKTETEPGHMAGTNPGAIPGCGLPAASVSVFRSCVVVEFLSALCDCRLLSLMVACVVLRRSAAARERTLPGSLGRGPFPAFPGCRLRARLCGERAAQAEAEVERSEGKGEAQGRSVGGGALRF